MRVLLVEDEHKISAYVKRGLEEAGYAVDAVFTGQDALDRVHPVAGIHQVADRLDDRQRGAYCRLVEIKRATSSS